MTCILKIQTSSFPEAWKILVFLEIFRSTICRTQAAPHRYNPRARDGGETRRGWRRRHAANAARPRACDGSGKFSATSVLACSWITYISSYLTNIYCAVFASPPICCAAALHRRPYCPYPPYSPYWYFRTYATVLTALTPLTWWVSAGKYFRELLMSNQPVTASAALRLTSRATCSLVCGPASN